MTGTLTGGSLSVDDDVLVEPGHRRARVRKIESRHEAHGSIGPGTRVALNLAGVEHHDLRRGDAVVRPDQWAAVDVVDVAVVPVPGSVLPRRAALHAHVGSGEHAVRSRVLDDAGELARLRFDTALPLAPGDRLVLRSTGRRAVVAGAEVLDVAPPRRVADAVRRAALPLPERVLAARPWCSVADLVQLAGVDERDAAELAARLAAAGSVARVGAVLVARSTLDAVRARAVELVRAHHDAHPLDAGIDLAMLASRLELEPARVRGALADDPELVTDRDIVRHVAHTTRAAEHDDARRLLDALDAAPFAPPAPAELGVDPAVVRALAREGAVHEIDGVVFARRAPDDAARLVAAALHERGTLSIADIRDLLGSTRKYVLPLVHHCDATGVTRRRGDDRIAGPRAERLLP